MITVIYYIDKNKYYEDLEKLLLQAIVEFFVFVNCEFLLTGSCERMETLSGEKKLSCNWCVCSVLSNCPSIGQSAWSKN